MEHKIIQEIVIRLLLAVLCGGIIGVEREKRSHAAGFRTYTLVCLGSALVTMTGEFSISRLGTGDPTRIAAQVVSGVGFLGAGTIILNREHQIKGLTTAAGIWISATIGIAIGTGFYLGAILTTLLVIIILTIFKKVQAKITKVNKISRMFVECKDLNVLKTIRKTLITKDMKILDLEIFYENKDVFGSITFIILVEDKTKKKDSNPIDIIKAIDGVIWIELL
ncbi:Protein SapB [Fusobacterium sp. DD29]|uniref:MgtC/SapB family protein n=1 Tax=unclassified Fusobacterium TaxID=2648384 RepID=UPI001B8B6330|nr:Protein SapB [Fusobacterium sp. DD45]MBR8711403.1 Protein SapB [Fusobacterium sp. DD28]MBR8749854.1 Protein SapB [Fusobacterium sp. DD29]MBR8751968.1 Protein SapB [Fusobacterium sp. DD26]MBR8762096.1 Protein SapB [Fusobacterium sp. DD25]MBR8768132.1 Protein SapB [Fusobacterium sp. DD43]MBR8772174.1 Protein SapB [Fusobacterium sp. DD40]MBR8776408.1 Protein SapB [Fusobacterium sp. DD17]MBR8798670.1 Protein SapB [Fusobacterium sp. DD12]MBR8801388.1 Protein SapB [Fusobacterium sp. DD10]MBR